MQANIVGQVCNGGIQEVFQRIRDFLCKRNGTYDYSVSGIGWTLHDSFYATNQNTCAMNDWYVVKSSGEDGNRDLYYRIKWTHTAYLTVEGYLYWNNTTHTGTLLFSNTYNIRGSATVMIMWLYGNLNYFMPIVKVASAYYGQYSGLLTKAWGNTAVAQTLSAVVAGTNRTLSLNSLPTTDWEVGKRVFIRDDDHAELITISYRDNILNEIKANLIYSYNPGAKICAQMTNFLSGSAANFLDGATTERLLIGKNGSVAADSNRYGLAGVRPTFVTSIGPDPQNGDYAVFPVTISCGTTGTWGYCGCLENVYQIVSTNLVNEDVVSDGVNNWRIFNCTGSNSTLAIKEV